MNVLLIALIVVLLTLILMRVLGKSVERFATVTSDIPAFLTALEEYNTLYAGVCKANPAQLECSNYQAPDTTNTVSGYKPPLLPGAVAFLRAVKAWDGTGAPPVLSPGDFGDRLPTTEALEPAIEFVYYAKPATSNARFENSPRNPALTPLEIWLNNSVNLWVTGAGTAGVKYGAYLSVGGKKYKFTKLFEKSNTPVHTLLVRNVAAGTELGVAYTAISAYPYRAVQGTVLETSDRLFTLLLEATSQGSLNTAIDELVATPVASSSSMAVAPMVSSSEALPKAGAGANREVLDLPELTYYEDAWFRNRALFAKMYGSVGQPSDEVKRYYQGAGAGAEGQTYELTALKFLELDRLILKGVTVNGVVNVARLQGYKLEVPYPYDPAMYDILNTMEEPSRDPVGLKCYSLTETQGKIIGYFARRPYENLAETNLQLMGQFRANLCASYGYYSKDGVEACKCEGCCIPVNYKTTYGARTGGVRSSAVVAEAEAKKELGSGDTGGCIYTSRAYRLKKRELPLGVEEGDVCVKEGFAGPEGQLCPSADFQSAEPFKTRGFTEDVGAAKATAGEAKGWRLFAQRVVPAYLPGAEGLASQEGLLCPELGLRTSEGFTPSDGCLLPSLPSPYRLRREKPRLMTCG